MNNKEKRKELVALLNNNLLTKTPFAITDNLVVEIHRIYCPEDFDENLTKKMC